VSRGGPDHDRAEASAALDDQFTIGVEEEYQLVDPDTRDLRPRGDRVLPAMTHDEDVDAQPELHASQVEAATAVGRTLADVRAELVRQRRKVLDAAAAEGLRVAAAGTHPFSHWRDQTITPTERYLSIERDFQHIARESVYFGFHVHVGIRDPDAAVLTMNRTRRWLPPLIALAANSPFWLGVDTGYASFRTELARRWPTAGIQEIFGSRAEYDEVVDALVSAGIIEDATRIYWDVRPSTHAETVEIRAMDVCSTVDEAVMIGALGRALAHTCWLEVDAGRPATHPRPELLLAAKWRAARSGIGSTLVDLDTAHTVPARVVVDQFLGFVRESLEERGEWEEVAALVDQTLTRGTGADRQRRAYRRTGSLCGVVDQVLEETAAL
jgi:carboxylate-amine ligase